MKSVQAVIFFIVGAVIAVLISRFFARSFRNARTLEPMPEAKTKPVTEEHHPNSRFRVTSRVRTQTNPFAEVPEDNTVPFKVVAGQAIAFGDLILGTPDDPEVREGFFEAPTPQLWDRPEIPYFIQPDLPNPQRVETALDYLHEHTSLTFVPFSGQQDALVFEAGNNHCYSLLGRVGGHQSISLADGCQWGEILHEVMHALGFVHEQSRTDRDQYLQIQWQNIQEEYQDQFAIVPETFMRTLKDSPFDSHSVMLYRANTFARLPNLVTMVAQSPFAIQPVEQGLSEEDIRRIDRLYPK